MRSDSHVLLLRGCRLPDSRDNYNHVLEKSLSNNNYNHDNVDYRKSWGDNQNLVNHGNSLEIIKFIVKLDRSQSLFYFVPHSQAGSTIVKYKRVEHDYHPAHALRADRALWVGKDFLACHPGFFFRPKKKRAFLILRVLILAMW